MPSPVVEEATLKPIPLSPCTPNPCGPSSQCQVVSGQAECGCLANMIGSAPNCRPECIVNSDCPASVACVNQKCIDPCPGTCGSNSECRVVNHSPVCTCATGYTGNAFSDCRPTPIVGKTNLYTALFLCIFLLGRKACVIFNAAVNFFFCDNATVILYWVSNKRMFDFLFFLKPMHHILCFLCLLIFLLSISILKTKT